MITEGYRATGWLGIVTEGFLWTPLYGSTVAMLALRTTLTGWWQIKLAAPNDDVDDDEDDESEACKLEPDIRTYIIFGDYFRERIIR